jgi:arachidonate 15-lipoxygenase
MTTTTPQETTLNSGYEYNYNRFINIDPDNIDPSLTYPMAANVLFKDNSLTKLLWAYYVVSTLLRIRSNQTLYDIAINKKIFSTIKFIFDFRLLTFVRNPDSADTVGGIYQILISFLKYMSSRSTKMPIDEKRRVAINSFANNIIGRGFALKVRSIQKQERRYQKMREIRSTQENQDIFQIIYLPDIANHAQEDKVFASQRVAGVNPLVISRLEGFLDKFPITDAHYQAVMGTDDSLQKALSENRLYLTDYQDLNDIVPGTIELNNSTIDKYIYQPIALFAVEMETYPNRRLVPVAIQCHQEPSPENPIFVAPSIDSSESERWAWQMAKMTVQIADANYHEFISHLGGTHLWMEPIAITTYRKLPLEHPLGALLIPHFMYLKDLWLLFTLKARM